MGDTDNSRKDDGKEAVVSYNTELWFRFIHSVENLASDEPEPRKHDLNQSVDLLRAINSYRCFPDMDSLFSIFPELKLQEEYIEMLWAHFDSMEADQLSDLTIQMIQEIPL